MTEPTRFSAALRGACKGIIPGAICCTIALHSWIVANAIINQEAVSLISLIGSLPCHFAACAFYGGPFGAVVGFVIGWESYNRPARARRRLVRWCMIQGVLAGMLLTALCFLWIVVSEGQPVIREFADVWQPFAFAGAMGGMIGLVIGRSLHKADRERAQENTLSSATQP